MSRIHSEASAVMDARPAEVYALIADYRNGHPRMLPKEHFRDLVVEQGGVGADTVITFTTIAGGRQMHFRMRISEPELGRVIAENDTASDLVTTFTITPVDGGARTQVVIATDQETSKGLRGLIERLLVPSMLKGIYNKELKQLADVLSDKRGGSVSAD